MHLGKHQTMDSATSRALTWLEGQPCVSKTILCQSRYQKHSRTPGTIAVKEVTNSSVRVTAYGDNDLREVHLYTDNPMHLLKLIYTRWPTAQESNGRIKTAMASAFENAKLKSDTPATPTKPVKAKRVLTIPYPGSDVAPAATPAPEMPLWLQPVPAPVVALQASVVTSLPDIKTMARQVSTEVESLLMEVTPELALEWLTTRNKVNRKLKPAFIQRMIRVITTGKWDPHAGVIHFDTEGNLINGQNRLTAIFEAMMTVLVRVDLNVPRETAGNLDTLQTTRSDTDIARILHQDTKVTALHFATASRVWFRGRRRPTTGGDPGPQERQDILAVNRDAIDFTVQVARAKILPASVLAPIARAYYTVDREQLRAYGGILVSGFTIEPRGQSVIHLRNWLVSTRYKRDEAGDLDAYRRGARTLRAFLDNEVLTRLYAPESEQFPIPEGKEAEGLSE